MEAKKPHARKTVKKVGRKKATLKPATPAVTDFEERETRKNFYAVGKRKTARAQVLLSLGSGAISVNQLPFERYFPTPDLRHIIQKPLSSVGMIEKIDIKSKISGGGLHAQAESLRHAISKALVLLDPESRRTLKKQGFLTRDARIKERKKPGLKRARRAPQFSKR